jgi:hypothetical protein
MLRSATAVLRALPLLLAGCGGVPFLVPDSRTAADRAREVEPRCASFTEESAAPMLAVTSIDRVEPAYSYVSGGPGDRQANLRGAKIHVKPLPGFSREGLARGLSCHEARVTLGKTAPRLDDPYTLRDQWLDIDVDSEGDGFVVLVRSDELPAAKEALERARRFAAARGP